MFALTLLPVHFADGMGGSGEMALRDARSIRVEVLQAKGLQELRQLDTDGIRATPKRIGQAHARQMVNRMPQPALVRFILYETPPLLPLRRLHPPDLNGP